MDSLGNWQQINIYTDSLPVSECGDYNVIVFNGSTPSDTMYFFVSCPMNSVLREHENVDCFGDSSGMLKEVVVGGVPFDPDGVVNSGDEYYNYQWYKDGLIYISGVNDTVIENLVTGQYYVQVTDSNGCIFQPLDSIGGTSPSIISSPDLLKIDSLEINTVHCKGTNTGSVLLYLKGGKRFSSNNYYDLSLLNSLNDTIRMINRIEMTTNVYSGINPFYVQVDSLGVGFYTIYVSDSFGCILDTTIYIMEPDSYSLHVSTNPHIICEQDSTWLKIDSVSGGHSIISYNWFDTNLDSIYVRSGIYNVFINDLNYGCKDSIEYSLSAPNTIYCNVFSDISECFGINGGSLAVDSIYGGLNPYSVQWGGIDTNNLYAGLYTLLITDSLGCIYMEDYEVFENPNVNLNEIIYHPLCNGNSDGSITISLSGGSPPLNYSWMNGTGNPDSLSSLSAGIYVLQTTDYFGCNFVDSVIVIEPDFMNVNFSGYTTPLNCNGEQTLINADISGGTPPYNILWSNSNISNQIIDYAGTYSVDITDTNGCFTTNQIIITEPNQLTVTGSFIPSTCDIPASATINVDFGTPPYSYIWSNGNTSITSTGFNTGDHWALVTDSCGDTVTYNFSVIEYELEIDVFHVNNPDNFAEVEVIFSTAGAPFSYQWFDKEMATIIGETNSVLENLCPEWYYVIITDLNNCQVTDSVLAELYFPIGGVLDETTTTVYDDDNLWGSGPYTYLWDNGDVTAHGNICPGFHRVWVTDVYGCEVMGELTVDDIILALSPSDLLIECDITNIDLELEVTASGGTGLYSYLWNSGETINPINLSLNPGLYSVQVTDENFCTSDTVFNILALSSECIPNVFTPNSDGSNDEWNLEDSFFYFDSEVRVYNRYGKLVFKSIGYVNPWNGTNQSGNLVEDGVYFYVIDLGNNIDKIKGTVTIVR